MQFTYKDINYRVEFQRFHKQVTVYKNGTGYNTQSKYPYTMVRLLELSPKNSPRVIASATAGCLPTDVYSNAQGRLQALRKLSERLRKSGAPRALTAGLWVAYSHRGEQPKSKTVAIVINPLPALPPTSSAPAAVIEATPI